MNNLEMLKKLKVNFFGEGFRLSKLNEVYASIAEQSDEDLNAYLNDYALRNRMNDLIIVQGLLNTYQNRIEIWFGGKKIHKTRINEVAMEGLLFPLFNVRERKIELSDRLREICFEEREMGLVFSFEKQIKSFQSASLLFHQATINQGPNSLSLFEGLSYDGLRLKPGLSDTVVTRSYYYRI
ncbi:hypothetical protein [Pedobacter aquatilis]|uniref:hypothetical protein n=1 Tax=Pedobacter aquatilis TaxID=351343 RepID=UPI002931E89E|nr:hypothetical protein [Pedobacter aquatilis]